MTRKDSVSFDTVRDVGLSLPDVQESTAYGLPALKVRGQILACMPANRSAEPASLAVRMDFDDRAALLAEAPDVYYVTDHYVDHNFVLVRLSRLKPHALRDLLGMAYKSVASTAVPRLPPPHRKGRSRK
jgi:hypothetical protein